MDKKLQIDFIVPKGFAISNFPEREISLKIKGSKAFVGNIFSNNETFTVDLNPYFKKSGKSFKIFYHPSQISVPFGVDILEMRPRESIIEVDKMAKMELPIRVQYIGSLPYDKKFKEIKLEPNSIMVSGPIEIVKKFQYLDSNPINLSNINNDEGSVTVSLDELDSRLSFEENPRVKLKYKVQLTLMKKIEKKK